MTEEQLEASYQARKALVGKIAESDGKLNVNGQTITIDHLADVAYFGDEKVSKKYTTTQFITISKDDVADTAYALRQQGTVAVLLSTKVNKRVGRSTLYTQSLIGPELIRDNTQDRYSVIAKGLPIFLNKYGQYIPPRKIDVIVAYPALINEFAEEYQQIRALNNILFQCSDYDFVIFDGNDDIPSVLANKVKRELGVIRCLITTN